MNKKEVGRTCDSDKSLTILKAGHKLSNASNIKQSRPSNNFLVNNSFIQKASHPHRGINALNPSNVSEAGSAKY